MFEPIVDSGAGDFHWEDGEEDNDQDFVSVWDGKAVITKEKQTEDEIQKIVKKGKKKVRRVKKKKGKKKKVNEEEDSGIPQDSQVDG